MRLRYLINKEKDFETLLEHLNEEPYWAYDTETNGLLSRVGISCVGISFGFSNFACYIPLNHLEGEQLPIDYVLHELKPIFEDPSKTVIAHNAKYDEMVLSVYGIRVQATGEDTLIMAWLLQEARKSKGLKPLTKYHLGIEMETYEDVVNRAPKPRGKDRDFNFARVSLDSALSYAGDDAYYTFQLYERFKPQLEKEGLLDAYAKIERPLSRVLLDVEEKGVQIDLDYFEKADKRLPELSVEVEAAIFEAAGEIFSIRSPKQLGNILYKKLGIGDYGTQVLKTKSGNPSTDQKTLKHYKDRYPIVSDVLRYKKIGKTHSTFVEGLKAFIEKDGKVHPSFNSVGTKTGRFSCSEPNLQQIESDEVEEIKIRNFFVPEEGNVFVVADYEQIELRIIAHCSRDKNMTKVFADGRSLHEELRVSQPVLAALSPVKGKLAAKSLNFGVPYGRGPKSVAEQLGITMKQAYKFISAWHKQFPRVDPYKKKVIEDARKKGYIRTLSGRKRRLYPEIVSDDWKIRSNAERQAFNTRIQGSAADIIKLAMVALQPKLVTFNASIIIQIHDELVVETSRSNAYDVSRIVKQTMEYPLDGMNPLRLPLVTEPKIVEKWGDAKG